MTDHSDDERLKNMAKALENANEANEPDHQTGELDDIKDFVMRDDEKNETSITLMNMPDEEESSDIHSDIEDVAEQLDNPENSPADENAAYATANKRIELTESDYADIQPPEGNPESTGNNAESGREESETEDETTDSIQETVNESGAVHTSREKPKAWPVEPPDAPSTPRLHTGMATAFGLLGIVAASGALWMNFTLSDRISQLEMQLPGNQETTTVSGQHKEIALLNRRMNDLAATVASLTATDLNLPPAVASQDNLPESPRIADINTPSGNHQGIWVLNLISLNNAVAADHELKRLQQLGIHAENVKAEVQGKTWYRIRIPGFASVEEATRQRKILANRLGIHDTWIGKR